MISAQRKINNYLKVTKQKGFAPLIIIVAVALITGTGVVVGYEIFFHQNNQPAKVSPAPAASVPPNPFSITNPYTFTKFLPIADYHTGT